LGTLREEAIPPGALLYGRSMKNVHSFVKTKGVKDGEREGGGMKASASGEGRKKEKERPPPTKLRGLR